MINIMKPSAALLSKLGSIAVHVVELLSSDGHQFDRVALTSLLADSEVREWLSAMDDAAMLPKKRREVNNGPNRVKGLPAGRYRTRAGSEMIVSGEHGVISRVEFDWAKEGACPYCTPEPYADEDGFLIWRCDECGGGCAALAEVPIVRRS